MKIDNKCIHIIGKFSVQIIIIKLRAHHIPYTFISENRKLGIYIYIRYAYYTNIYI